ncbi:putative golgi apparatus membrane protein tvp18 protein [Phaeoacremonium minimum UCRPA7]|uniref:Putative golgi apparatus membrane protein tvp18 protein n=1 Tax=Phaeoacremonium minimum (strain UCR-PA7) TaxID=1286976 RepID=R8BWK3_PHAM7|nr:putative golgi apparatus membrane protein tvp18 protein [Phaeoacremonium minimum UCRPA7]EOO03715.1 putative golgi apparatus membrane protein tvp18 protein [Phaeoacremonium minimum UCRPA7]
MTLKEEFATRNFSIYGQWLGILSMILCFALGIANIFTGHVVIIILSIVCLCSSFVILFIEVPLLLRICPTSSTFDAAIRRVSTNYMRAAAYGAMALAQWLTLLARATSLIAAAVVLTLTGLCYLLAGVKGQAFVGSKTLGGQGVAQMIV